MLGSGRQRAGRLVSHQFVNFDIQTCSNAELDTSHREMGEAADQMEPEYIKRVEDKVKEKEELYGMEGLVRNLIGQ